MNYFTANQDIFVRKISKEAIYFGIASFILYQYVRGN